MKPSEVLDYQADLIDRANMPMFQQVVHGTLTAAYDASDANLPVALRVAGNGLGDRLATQLTQALPYTVRAAEAYHVSPDMSALIQAVATQLDDLDRFDVEAAPTPQGFARFDVPLPIRDIRGKQMLVHWIVWSRLTDQHGTPVIATWMFNDWAAPDEIAQELTETFGEEWLTANHGRWGYIGTEIIAHEQRMGPAMIAPNDEIRARLIEEGTVPSAYTNHNRYLHAFFLLLNQTITRVARQEADRVYARRARRKKLPSRVTVITLRRAEYIGKPEGDAHVEWSHQWLVRAHLRWQPCGPDHPIVQKYGLDSPSVQHLGGDRYAVRIVIKPYFKGPPDKPLIITKKVYGLHR